MGKSKGTVEKLPILCERKGVEKATACKNHAYMLVNIPSILRVSSLVGI